MSEPSGESKPNRLSELSSCEQTEALERAENHE